MAVQQEIKSHLAKLLATEDIVVEHKQVESAQFNVRTRVLILPLWEKASNDVYDMLVGHEVGHALFTPDEDWWLDHDIPQQFVNLVEDARIEKLMKRKYMGLAKSFYKGYSELHDKDFFELDGQDIDSLNLADRANLHFKLSSVLSISFSSTEKQIIDLINDCETFTQTLSAAEALYNFCKQEQEGDSTKKELEAKQDFLNDLKDGGTSDVDDAGDNTPSVSDIDSSGDMEDRGVCNVDSSGNFSSDVIVETVDSLRSNIQNLVNKKGGTENVYLEVPEVNLDSVIAPNEEVHAEIDKYWGYEKKLWAERAAHDGYEIDLGFAEVDDEFFKFKGDAQKEVSYLVKEFECRKSASAYARSATSRTGVLDTTKLQTYRFNEDLFKKITTLPDGKNHGLVFILDWSGSMQYVLQDTLKQLYNLMWFCRKVQIPFEVYAFTQEWNNKIKDYETGDWMPSKVQLHYKKKEGMLVIDDAFNLMNLFSSKVKGKTLEQQMVNIWRLAASFGGRDGYRIHYGWPQRMILSGTPLNEALISLYQILPKFKKETGVEKVQCIILTDGEANGLPYHVTVQRNWESNPYLGQRNPHPERSFLRDRQLGKTYKIGYHYHGFTQTLLNNLKDRFSSTNFIGIRVLNNRDAKSFMRLYNEDHSIDWRKTKTFTIKNSGYDAYFAMSSNSLAEDADFDVDEDATKAQIKRAFVKSLKTKKLNKKVLGEFIELVV